MSIYFCMTWDHLFGTNYFLWNHRPNLGNAGMKRKEKTSLPDQCRSNRGLRQNQRLVIPCWIETHGTLKAGCRLFPVSESTKFFRSLTSELLKRQRKVCLSKMLWRFLRRRILVQLILHLYTSWRWVISFMLRVSYSWDDNHPGTWWRKNSLPNLKIETPHFNQ
jgi:hypothetical protein